MILALDKNISECLAQIQDDVPQLKQRLIALQIVLANVWQTIGQVWKIPSLVALAQEVSLISLITLEPPTDYAQALSRLANVATDLQGTGINVEEALKYVAGTKNVQDIIGLDNDQLIRRLSMKWTPNQAFRTGSSFTVQISVVHCRLSSAFNTDIQRQC